ncbi:MAG: 6,7-dimethyl-8-ribityllumazine synthase [Salinibacterium sp.]|nr:6,7-dimethyl-8-ribityllumazine synthase [Salinibacterium sp.]
MQNGNRISEIAVRSRVGVVISRYNAVVTDQLLSGARSVLGSPTDVEAPGAYELPAITAAMASSGAFDGVLALGCVIKGETDHDRYIDHAVAEGLMSIAVTTGVPVGFGVLTCSTIEQAVARAKPASEGGGDKGAEAASALLATIDQLKRIASGGAKPGRTLDLPFTPSDKARGQR